MKRLLFIPFLLLASLAQAYHPGLVGVIGKQASSGGVSVPAFIQAKSVYNKSSSITLDSAVTEGNTLIAVLSSVSTTTDDGSTSNPSMIGGCAVAWTEVNELHPSSGWYNKIFYCQSASSGSNAISISTWLGGDGAWYLVEASNVGVLDVTATAHVASGSSFGSGNATPTTNASFMIGVFQTNQLTYPTFDGTWTKRSEQTGHVSAIATKVVNSTSAQSVYGTINGDYQTDGYIYVFKGD